MNSIFLSAISLSGYCGFLLEACTEGVEENARTWAAVAAVLPPLTHCTSSASTQSNASGGGAPCVTAGDTRAERGGTRGKVDSTNLRRWRRRTESVEKVSSISPPRKNSFLLSHYCQTLNTYIFSELYPKYDNVTT